MHGILSSYRDALLQGGGAAAVACLPAPRALASMPVFSNPNSLVYGFRVLYGFHSSFYFVINFLFIFFYKEKNLTRKSSGGHQAKKKKGGKKKSKPEE